MRTILIALALMPLTACGVAQTTVDAAQNKDRDRAEGSSKVTVAVPRTTEPVPATEMTEDERFRRDMLDPERFLVVQIPGTMEAYVLDRTTGCAYHRNSAGTRDQILSATGRPDCSYAQR